MTQSLTGSWTRNHPRGTIHPHRERWGLLYPLTSRVKGSGLEFMRTVLKAERALGEEALPKDLQEEVRLWSRAELPACGLSDMVREICRGLVDEAG